MQLGDYDINTRLQKFLAETNEIGAIRSTIETQTAWMTQPMREDMDTHGLNFRDIRRRPTTIYVILPTEELQRKAVWLAPCAVGGAARLLPARQACRSRW